MATSNRHSNAQAHPAHEGTYASHPYPKKKDQSSRIHPAFQGFYIGDWSLSGNTVHITNLTEKHPVPAHATGEVQEHKYVFQMTLALRSRPLGRWNKLDFIGYDSVKVEDGEAIPLPLKHVRSFWFSKVRSWAGY
jgi:F-box protein 9